MERAIRWNDPKPKWPSCWGNSATLVNHLPGPEPIEIVSTRCSRIQLDEFSSEAILELPVVHRCQQGWLAKLLTGN